MDFDRQSSRVYRCGDVEPEKREDTETIKRVGRKGVYTALMGDKVDDRILTLFLDKRREHGRALLSRRFRMLRLCQDSSQLGEEASRRHISQDRRSRSFRLLSLGSFSELCIRAERTRARVDAMNNKFQRQTEASDSSSDPQQPFFSLTSAA
jgi:hypothetical protein